MRDQIVRSAVGRIDLAILAIQPDLPLLGDQANVHPIAPCRIPFRYNLPCVADNDQASEDSAKERFHDTDRSFRVYRLSGLILEHRHGEPSIGILPDGTRLTQADGESAVDFLDRCEGQIVTESVFVRDGDSR